MRSVRFSTVAAVMLAFALPASAVLAGHNESKPFVCGTQTQPPVPTETQPAPKPVVRDHRHTLNVVVRDHRNQGGAIVRDHRDQGGVIVRDHRDESNVIVRDHRTPTYTVRPSYTVPVYKVPVKSIDTSNAPGGVVVTSHATGPVIRDHRQTSVQPSHRPSGPSLPSLPLPKLPITVHLPF